MGVNVGIKVFSNSSLTPIILQIKYGYLEVKEMNMNTQILELRVKIFFKSQEQREKNYGFVGQFIQVS